MLTPAPRSQQPQGAPVLRVQCFAHPPGDLTGVSDVTGAPDPERRTVIALLKKKNRLICCRQRGFWKLQGSAFQFISLDNWCFLPLTFKKYRKECFKDKIYFVCSYAQMGSPQHTSSQKLAVATEPEEVLQPPSHVAQLSAQSCGLLGALPLPQEVSAVLAELAFRTCQILLKRRSLKPRRLLHLSSLHGLC